MSREKSFYRQMKLLNDVDFYLIFYKFRSHMSMATVSTPTRCSYQVNSRGFFIIYVHHQQRNDFLPQAQVAFGESLPDPIDLVGNRKSAGGEQALETSTVSQDSQKMPRMDNRPGTFAFQ